MKFRCAVFFPQPAQRIGDVVVCGAQFSCRREVETLTRFGVVAAGGGSADTHAWPGPAGPRRGSHSLMHVDSPPPAPPPDLGDRPWWRLLTKYHWFVFAVAAIAWMADCLDQQLFNLARVMSLTDLNGGSAANPDTVKLWAGMATSIFLVGWATGGLIFGMFGDKIGRVRTLT